MSTQNLQVMRGMFVCMYARKKGSKCNNGNEKIKNLNKKMQRVNKNGINANKFIHIGLVFVSPAMPVTSLFLVIHHCVPCTTE
jgi:hypothetical protein